MSCSEAMEACIAFRGAFLETVHPDLDLLDIDPDTLPIVTVTDCKSLYDTMHRDGQPKAPTERRLEIDLAALRQMYNFEISHEGGELERGVVPLRWVPTAKMLADAMTKMCDPSALIEALRKGEIHVPHL